MPRKRPRRRVATSRPRPLPPTAMDTCGRTTSCSTPAPTAAAQVPDGHRRVHAGVLGDRRRRQHPISRVIEVLRSSSASTARRGTCAPTTGRSSCRARFCAGYRRAQIETAFIDPGKPWQNGTDESSTASSATSASRCSGSAIAPMRRSSSKPGAGTTTRSGLIRASGI